MRFDEIELEPVPFEGGIRAEEPADGANEASRFRRLLVLLTDLSLLAALALALSPLLPSSLSWASIAALGGFVVVVSYYYFVGCWMLWGKTIGGVIFEVKVVPADGSGMALRSASQRWAGVYLSLLTAGIGFALAALPSRRSLPDVMSGTRCVNG